MAQLRRDFEAFAARDTAIVVAGPEDPEAFAAYFAEHRLPFVGLPDPQRRVLRLYGQQIKLFKLGRMPAQLLVDKEGIVRLAHYGQSMSDIPENEALFAVIDRLNEESAAGSA
jgi:peroxiredoxin Q/BCP